MKRILLGALCAVTVLALLAGCGKPAASGGSASASAGSSGNSGSASGPIATLPDPGDQAVPANVTADWTEDAVSDWDTAPAEAEDGAAGIRIRTDAAVTEVRLAALTTEINGDGTASYTLGETLYAAASLTPEGELVAEAAFMGVLPDRCLCYWDTDGAERCFALAISGKDGSLMMMDITGEVH